MDLVFLVDTSSSIHRPVNNWNYVLDFIRLVIDRCVSFSISISPSKSKPKTRKSHFRSVS